MNARLRELLLAAGRGGDQLEWSDAVVLRNWGTVPPATLADAHARRHRGFDLLLLDARGAPRHFCKCRPVTDDEAAHETALSQVLCGDPALRTLVPATRGVQAKEMVLQISAYLPGPAYLREVGQQSPGAWERSMREILTASDLLAARAMALVPALVPRAEPAGLQELGCGALTDLVRAGLSAERAAALAQAMQHAGRMSRRLQHGDLWPGNIIRWAGSWWLLDLARYGWCQVPMFDAYHFVRSCCDLRHDDGSDVVGGWYEQMAAGDRRATIAQHTLAWVAGQLGLTPTQCIGALAYYSVDLTALLLRRQVLQSVWAPVLAYTERLADALRAGEPVECVFFGRRRGSVPVP